MEILIPVLILGGLGIIFGVGLAQAAKKFCVITDPRLEKVIALLPGANCGSCGMPGCMGFAEGLINGACTVDRCVLSAEDQRKKISAVLGLEVKNKIKTVAVLHCHGGKGRVKDKFFYNGARDCSAAALVMGGPKNCVFGCIGFGTCAKVCSFDAITMGEDELPAVDESKCTACGRCVAACPKKLFSLVAVSKAYAVRCKSLDFGKKVMDVCSAGCIGCGKCQKACPTGAAKVTDNLSAIDYHTCDNRGECYKVCPTKSIAKRENKKWVTR